MDRNDEIYKNLLELVGQTPMVQLNVITKDFPGNYFAKLEMFNPGHSQKDRIALHIVENAEKKLLGPASASGTPVKPLLTMVALAMAFLAGMPPKSKAFST